ncbi:unnamed protein product [Agarophyton chilense]
MIIKEYRISMPITAAEYYIAQLYMVAKSSQEETGKTAGEGIEIVRNEAFDENSPVNIHKMPPGQYTEKIMHLRSRLPKFVAMVLPVSMTEIVEKSWNSFPWCKTEYSNPFFGEKFYMSVETMHADDRGTQENAVNLPAEDLAKRKVDYLNIACEDPSVPMEKGEDPTKFLSEKTGRGNLSSTFMEDHDPIMTCYKVVKLRFKVFGLQSKAEQWGHLYGIRNPFLQYHRKIFCWIDEWYGMSIADIRAIEDKTAEITKQILEASRTQQKPQTERKSHGWMRSTAS